ncbi:hypothetical protein M3Y99_00758000 [Aphelenchoides fujianensis]|nr:hypothetical protein M3Y99_00758000 [Aphelenchoides fujianensis]
MVPPLVARDPEYYRICCLHVHTLTLFISFFLLVVNTIGLITAGVSSEYYVTAPFLINYIAIVCFFFGNRMRRHQLYIPYIVLSIISLVVAIVLAIILALKLFGHDVNAEVRPIAGQGGKYVNYFETHHASLGSLIVMGFYIFFHFWYLTHVVLRDYRWCRDEAV